MVKPPIDEALRGRVVLRAKSEEVDGWKREAKRAGFPSLSSWIRALANEELERAAKRRAKG